MPHDEWLRTPRKRKLGRSTSHFSVTSVLFLRADHVLVTAGAPPEPGPSPNMCNFCHYRVGRAAHMFMLCSFAGTSVLRPSMVGPGWRCESTRRAAEGRVPAGAVDGVVKFWDVRKFGAPAAFLVAGKRVRSHLRSHHPCTKCLIH